MDPTFHPIIEDYIVIRSNPGRDKMAVSRIGLGFDTGGTYTDAVIMDLESGELLARNKALTTRNDLSIGIRNAIADFDRGLLDRVSTVSMSSTLATNSIVEGKGCRVGLVCIGDELGIDVRVDEMVSVRGYFTAFGKEEEPLDEDAVRAFLESVDGKIDCLAVTGFMSVRNPKHEQRVKQMAKEILGIPAVCGYELSSGLGFNERAITSVMNARLIPVIDELLKSVSAVLKEFRIDTPLMVVRGDGSIMSEAMARERPIETILSGPASSINGANQLAGCLDSIVVDIGGTTTDIGVIRDGRPHLDPEGAIIGGYRTRVMAAEITTAGLGGDSRVILNGEKLYMSSLKVMPICVAASKYPGLRERLRGILDRPVADFPEAKYERNIIMDTEYFIKLKDPKPGMLNATDAMFLEFISKEPRSLPEAKYALQENPAAFDIPRMEELGLVQRVGMTPTDIMHARGVFTAYDAEASKLAIDIVARKIGLDRQGFIDRVDGMVTDKICKEILRKVIYEDSGVLNLTGFGLDLMDQTVNKREGRDYRFDITITKPIIGIGGPTYDMLPEVARRLGTTLIIPENYDVGNAVGAIIGKVEEAIEFIIQPVSSALLHRHYYQWKADDMFQPTARADGADPACTIYSRLGRFYLESFKEGLQFARDEGTKFIQAAMDSANAEDVVITVKEEETALLMDSLHNELIAEMKVTVKGVGKPKSRQERSEHQVRDHRHYPDVRGVHGHEEGPGRPVYLAPCPHECEHDHAEQEHHRQVEDQQGFRYGDVHEGGSDAQHEQYVEDVAPDDVRHGQVCLAPAGSHEAYAYLRERRPDGDDDQAHDQVGYPHQRGEVLGAVDKEPGAEVVQDEAYDDHYHEERGPVPVRIGTLDGLGLVHLLAGIVGLLPREDYVEEHEQEDDHPDPGDASYVPDEGDGAQADRGGDHRDHLDPHALVLGRHGAR